METHIITKAGQSQKRVKRNKSSAGAGYAPVCNKCGQPMKLDWTDSITGSKQIWCCRICFHYRVVKPSYISYRGSL